MENFYLSILTRILGVSVWINFRGNFPYQFLQEFCGFQHELMFRNIFPINSHKNLRGFSIEINFKKLRNLKIFKSWKEIIYIRFSIKIWARVKFNNKMLAIIFKFWPISCKNFKCLIFTWSYTFFWDILSDLAGFLFPT